MAVTFTATPEPSHVPPRVRLDLATNDVTKAFTDVTIRRDGRVIRAKASTGSSTSVVYDYDCPFGISVTYTADGAVNGFGSILDETWPNLSGWTTDSGSPAVAGGKLTAGVVHQALTGATQIVIHDADQFLGKIEFRTTNPFGPGEVPYLTIQSDGTNIGVIDHFDFWGLTTAPGTGDWTMTGNHVESTAGTWDGGLGGLNDVLSGGTSIVCDATGGAVTSFEVFSTSGTTPFSLSDTAELDVDEAWLIHPINPDLSLKASTTGPDRHDRVYVTEESAAEVVYDEQRELFSPLGRRRQIPVTYGDRRVGDWTLELFTPSDADRTAVLSLLQDQSPILLRVPPSFDWDLPDDWYSVGAVTDNRVLRIGAKHLRTMKLPLTPVDEPALSQGAQWTYGDDLILDPTYADSLDRFPTYLDRLVGPTG